MARSFFSGGILLAATLVSAQAALAQSCPTPAEIIGSAQGATAHLRYLADDALEGRDTGSTGERCAATYISDAFSALGLQPAGTGGGWFQGFEVAADTRAGRAAASARNVIGILPGTDPAHSGEYIIIGAHYDHLGRGGSGSLDPDGNQIHNGADDNASGTAALIAVAQELQAAGGLARPVIFIAFSGEERGLLGSSWFVRNPTVPIDGTVAMLNMDMVGRLRDNRITVFGEATAVGWGELVAGANGLLAQPLAITLMPDGFGPSDHSSFYAAGYPVLHFFTGTHSEYHRPEDDVSTINAQGLDRVVDLVSAVAMELTGSTTTAPPTMEPIAGVAPEATEGGRGYGPYFGSIPDMGAADVIGVRISGVRENSPAARAGLEAGDIIVGFGDAAVADLYEYTDALRAFGPGDPVNVTIQRNGRQLVLQAILGESRR